LFFISLDVFFLSLIKLGFGFISFDLVFIRLVVPVFCSQYQANLVFHTRSNVDAIIQIVKISHTVPKPKL